MQVIPAVLPHSLDHLAEKLERIEGLSHLVQIDLCDGIFGREKTWMPSASAVVPQPEGVRYQYDVMVSDWRPVIATLVQLAPVPDSIVMHVDSLSDEDLDELISTVKAANIKLGVSISNDTGIETLFNAVRKAQVVMPDVFIQVMGIKSVGEQGQSFDEESLSRICEVTKMFGGVPIQVDGGMRPETAVKVRDAGADAIVVGSYILRHDDPGTAYGELASI